VLSRLGDAGEEPAVAHRHLQEQGLIGGLLQLVSLTEDDAVAIARLRSATRAQGLLLGDRACLATGLRLGRPVITAELPEDHGPTAAGVPGSGASALSYWNSDGGLAPSARPMR
jgi:hypothetical protein